MRIPAREEFAPLPEVIDLLRLPDPLAVLPQLENQLEAVAGSTMQIRACVDELRNVLGDVEAGANAVVWQGVAAGKFRSTTAEMMNSLRYAADNIDHLAEELDTTSEGIKERIVTVVTILGSIAVIVGAVYVAVTATTTVGTVFAIVTVVGLVLLAIGAMLETCG